MFVLPVGALRKVGSACSAVSLPKGMTRCINAAEEKFSQNATHAIMRKIIVRALNLNRGSLRDQCNCKIKNQLHSRFYFV